MSQKRHNNKNRILRKGERQRKARRYAYKYTDTFGNPQFVYAWKLVPTDKTPAGNIGKKMTVCQLYAKQIRHRANVWHGMKQGYKRLMWIFKEDSLGGCPIENVKLSDAKEWALRMKEKVRFTPI